KGDLDRAIAAYGQAIGLDAKRGAAYENRAAAWAAKGDLEHAIADYGQAIGLDGKNARAYLGRAVARRRKGDLDGAIADDDQAIAIAIAIDPAQVSIVAAAYFN